MARLTKATDATGATRYFLRRPPGKGRACEPLGAITEAEAKRILAAVNRDEGGPTRVQSNDDALKAFYKSLRAQKRAEPTVDYYRYILGAVWKALGSRPIGSWRRLDLEAYLARKTAERPATADEEGAEGWSASTAAKTLRACRTFIRWAKAADLDVPDFTGGMKAPISRHAETHVYGAGELQAILAASIGTRVEVPVHLATYAGMPRGDLRALTWAEVDMEAGVIRKRRVKTYERMEIPMAPALKACLERHRGVGGIVCRDMPNMEPAALVVLHRVMRDAGIPSQSRHGWRNLRTSYATLLAAGGADVATVGALLGHRPGSAVTLKYIKADRTRTEAAITRLGATLAAQG